MKHKFRKYNDKGKKIKPGGQYKNYYKQFYLTPDNCMRLFDEAREYQQTYSVKWREYERIGDWGLPPDQVEPGVPNLTELSTSTIIADTAKRVVPAVPQTEISMLNPVHGLFVEWEFEDTILPNANFQMPLLSKLQRMVSGGAIYGCHWAEIMERTIKVGNKKLAIPDWYSPYTGDVIGDPGVSTLYEGGAAWSLRYFSEDQFAKLIEEQELLGDDSIYDIAKLKEVKDKAPGTDRDERSQSYQEERREYNLRDKDILLIVAHQKGIEAPQFIFCPLAKEIGIVGETTNTNYNGEMNLIPYYHKIVPYALYGQGICEQLYGDHRHLEQSKRLMAKFEVFQLNPMFIARGLQRSEIKWQPNYIIQAPQGQENEVGLDPVQIQTQFMDNFYNAQAAKRALNYARAGAYDTTSQSTSNVGVQSKTAAGVRDLQSKLGTNDQALRDQFLFFYKNLIMNMVNWLLQKRNGIHKKPISLDRFNQLVARGMEINDDNFEFDKYGRIMVIQDWTQIKNEALLDVQIKIDATFDIDKRERFASLVQFRDQMAKSPVAASMLNERYLTEEQARNIGLDPTRALIPKEDNPQEAIPTIPVIQGMIDKSVDNKIAYHSSQKAMDIQDMGSIGSRNFLRERGIDPGDSLLGWEMDKRFDEQKLKIEALKAVIQLRQLGLNAEQANKESQTLMQGGQKKPDTQEAEANQLPQSEGERTAGVGREADIQEKARQEQAIRSQGEMYKHIENSGGTEVDVLKAKLIFSSLAKGTMTQEEAQSGISEILDKLGQTQGGQAQPPVV